MEEFIRTLTEQMRCVRARDGVARELSGHILDQAEAYEQAGEEHDKAVERAVREMGDPVEIGAALDRIHRPQADWKMLALTFGLGIIGLVVIVSIYGPSMLTRQGFYSLAGIAVIAAVYFIDYSIIGRVGTAAYLVMTVLFFIGTNFLPQINGRIPAMSMLVYLYVPVFAGILYQLRKGGYGSMVMGIMVIMLTSVLAMRFSGSATVATNIFLIMVIMMIAAVRKNIFQKKQKHMAAVMVAVLILLTAAVLGGVWFGGAGYQRIRLRAFLHPSQYEMSAGYVYAGIRKALQGAKLVGAGSTNFDESLIWRNGMSPLWVIYNYGIAAGIALLALFAAFILRAVKIVRSQKNQLGFLVSMACFLVIFANCLEGILMSFGLCPVTTAAVPFLTHGGSTTLVYAVLIGLLLSVHRYEKVLTGDSEPCQPRWRISFRLEKR